MSDITAPQPQTGGPDTGSPMNLTCTSASSTQDGTSTIHVVISATPVSLPPGATLIYAPDPQEQFNVTGKGPGGDKAPPGLSISGSGICIYSIPT